MDYYEETPPLEFIGDVYDIMKDGDGRTPEKLNADIVDMLGKYLSAQHSVQADSAICQVEFGSIVDEMSKLSDRLSKLVEKIKLLDSQRSPTTRAVEPAAIELLLDIASVADFSSMRVRCYWVDKIDAVLKSAAVN